MPPDLKSTLTWRRAFVWGAWALGVIAVILFCARIPRTLSIFTIAAFIAAGVVPIVHRLRHVMPRLVAIGVVYVGLFGMFAVLAFLVVPATFNEVQVLGINAPEYVADVQTAIAHNDAWLREHFGRAYLPTGYNSLTEYFSAKASVSFNYLLGSLAGAFVWTANAAFVTVSGIVLSAFFVIQGRGVIESFYGALSPERRPVARALGRELGRVFGGYVAGQAALCAITGFAIFAISAVTGFHFAFLLGIVCGIAYAVPFVGTIVAQILALVLALPQGPSMVIWVSAIVFVVSRIADNVLVPKVMSDSVGVSPIAVMFAVFAGGELFGLPGLVLGIPAAALARAAWKFYHSPEVAAQATRADLPAPEVVAKAEAAGIVIVGAVDPERVRVA